jgi:hypothetical protein
MEKVVLMALTGFRPLVVAPGQGPALQANAVKNSPAGPATAARFMNSNRGNATKKPNAAPPLTAGIGNETSVKGVVPVSVTERSKVIALVKPKVVFGPKTKSEKVAAALEEPRVKSTVKDVLVAVTSSARAGAMGIAAMMANTEATAAAFDIAHPFQLKDLQAKGVPRSGADHKSPAAVIATSIWTRRPFRVLEKRTI